MVRRFCFRATPNRKVAETIGEGPTYVFKVNAPARPKVYSYKGEWMKPESVELEVKCGM